MCLHQGAAQLAPNADVGDDIRGEGPRIAAGGGRPAGAAGAGGARRDCDKDCVGARGRGPAGRTGQHPGHAAGAPGAASLPPRSRLARCGRRALSGESTARAACSRTGAAPPVSSTVAVVRFFRAPTKADADAWPVIAAIETHGRRPERRVGDFRALPSNLLVVRLIDVRCCTTAANTHTHTERERERQTQTHSVAVPGPPP
jgi:hypothetical protein